MPSARISRFKISPIHSLYLLKYHERRMVDNGVRLDARSQPTQSPRMAKLTIRVDLDQEAAFGPGKARLLEALDERGSIRAAAIAMQMSYRRAWLLVQDIESTT